MMNKVTQKDNWKDNWDAKNPFDRRFSSDFFKQVPRQSGVFWMQDGRRKILYLSHARDLREELSWFRMIDEEKTSSKIKGFLSNTRNISWSITPTFEMAAQLKWRSLEKHESLLFQKNLLDHHGGLIFQKQNQQILLHFRPLTETDFFEEAQDFVYKGAFAKTLSFKRVLASQSRLLWWFGHHNELQALPKPLSRSVFHQTPPMQIYFSKEDADRIFPCLLSFWSGESSELLDLITQRLKFYLDQQDVEFYSQWIQQDFKRLETYFQNTLIKRKGLHESLTEHPSLLDEKWIDHLAFISSAVTQ